MSVGFSIWSIFRRIGSKFAIIEESIFAVPAIQQERVDLLYKADLVQQPSFKVGKMIQLVGTFHMRHACTALVSYFTKQQLAKEETHALILSSSSFRRCDLLLALIVEDNAAT